MLRMCAHIYTYVHYKLSINMLQLRFQSHTALQSTQVTQMSHVQYTILT